MHEQLGLGFVEGDILPFKKIAKRRKKRVEFSKDNKAFDFHDLSNVVIGQFNDEAHKYLQSYLNSINESLFPLYLHGISGVGKSHLIFGAIGEYLRAKPYRTCKFFTGKDFIEERNAASEVDRKGEFLEDCQSVDVLILDDLHEVSSSNDAISDLLYVSSKVSQRGGKVIFCSKFSPAVLKSHSPILADSIQGFSIRKIECFDSDSCVAILKLKVTKAGIILGSEIFDCLSYCSIQSSFDIDQLIREIFRIKISESLDSLNFAALSKHGVIKLPLKEANEIELFLKSFAEDFSVNLQNVRSRSRKATFVIDRHIVMHYLNHVKGISLNRIAAHFDRDHTVALYAVRKIDACLNSTNGSKFFERIEEYRVYLSAKN